VTLAEDVGVTGGGDAHLAVAANGTLAYIPEEPRSLILVDRKGAARMASEGRRTLHGPAISPDGRKLAVDVVSASGRDVWILDLDQGTLERATFDRDGHDAVWTPDGRHITYATFKSGVLGIYRVRPGSNAPAESLFASRALNHPGYWLPDGSGLVTVASELNPGSAQDIGIVRNGGRGPLEPLVATQFRENFPAVSPDGRWLAFVSDQSGETRVYARPISGDGDQVQVSQGAGSEPVWSRDGREVFYQSYGDGGARELVAAKVETSPALRVTAREMLFPVNDYLPTTPHSSYDVSPDGKTFAMVRRNAASRIVVIQNFPELVRRKGGAAGPE
jgi:Tol biopolymer transport system component